MKTMLCLVTMCVLGCGVAMAQPHAGDVELRIESNRITTFEADGPSRVFESEFDATSPPSTIEPGFDSEPGTFTPGSPSGFRVLDVLRVWNGAGFAGQASSVLEIAFSTLSVTTPTTPQIVEGFTLQVGSNGQWHRHLEFALLGPAESGVYLLAMQLHSNAGLEDSQPFWIVFNNGEPEGMHEAAVEWVRVNLAGESACNADVNCDFALDGFDVEVQERAVGGDVSDYCLPDPDFNGDLALDGFDVEAVEVAVGGGPCPS